MSSLQKAIFLCRTGRGRLLEAIERSMSPDDFLYGFGHLMSGCPRAMVLEIQHPHFWLQKLDRGISRYTRKLFGENFPFFSVLNSIWRYRNSSTVFYTNIDTHGLVLAFQRLIGLVDFPVVHVSQGLTNFWEKRTASVFGRISISAVGVLLGQMSALLVLGKGAKKATSEIFERPAGSIKYLPFGVELNFWDSGKSEGGFRDSDYILAVGSDAQRDYESLIEQDFPLPLKIVTRLDVAVLKSDHTVLRDVDDRKLRDLYSSAKLTLIPLKESAQPSGQSTALQAMACGCPVLKSRTSGLFDEEVLKDEENIFLIPTGLNGNMDKITKRLLDDPERLANVGKNGKKLVEEHYDSSSMGKKLENIVTRLSPGLLL